MHKITAKSFTASLMAVAVAAMLFASAFMAYIPSASAGEAAPLTPEELFGGSASYNGANFAAEAGLGSGDLPSTIAAIIRVALGFLGVVAVVIILFGGFKWMTAGGEQGKVDDARKLIIAGVIGLAIILSAYAIASFVIGSLATAIGGAG